MSVEDITTGELARGLGRVEKAIDSGFKQVNDRIDHLESKYVTKDLYESERDGLREQIAGAVSAWRWRVTTGLAGVAVVMNIAYALAHLH